MRLESWLVMSCCALLGCTPEATVIDAPNGGASGAGGGKGDGGKASRPPVSSGGAPSGECTVVESDRPDCADCLTRECAQEVEACAGTDCLCGDFLGSTGQINCILACPNLSARLDSVNACARQCGFEDLMHMEPHAHDLWDCLVNPPGPPVCPSCVSPPQ